MDLEPDLCGARVVALALAGAAGHVGEDGALVGVGPLGPGDGDGAARGRGGGQLRGRAAGVLVPVALDVLQRQVLDGAVAGDLAEDARRRGRVVRVRVRVVPVERLPGDHGLGDVAVGVDNAGGEERGRGGEEDGDLHVCFWWP